MPRKPRESKQVKKTIQDMKIEIEALMKIQTEGIREMENLSKRTGSTDASITNRILHGRKNLRH